ncbi:hypothetical protein [Absidia glauca]|uniref:Peptidase M24 domain-containing protein n=1 Tax=Absidia glauca TaxID=4829 RepID=A0A163J9D8_ABSGL|nr:hypothetical protein [Absidia glauca]
MTLGNNETTPMLPRRQSSNHWNKLKHKTMILRTLLVLGVLAGLVVGIAALQFWHPGAPSPPPFNDNDEWHQALDALAQDAKGCVDGLPRVPGEQYIDRQNRLFDTMQQEGVFAYVMEPSSTFLYYTNLTWTRTERPFLVVFTDDRQMTIITPAFEATRAKEQWIKANLPAGINPSMVEWVEHGSAFDTVRDVLKSHHSQSQAIQIEPTTRYFIAEGIRASVDHSVHIASQTLQQLRMVKTQEEIAIIQCTNRISVRAIETLQHHGIHIGMSEQMIAQRMIEALHRVGLTETWVLALVDANAAFPHGQPGKPHDVTPSSLILIDAGGKLYDYQSDVTRTFFIDPAAANHTIKAAWRSVRNAQQAVLDNIKAGDSCAHVDLTARNLISDAGWGDAFTHRLGHGIGLEMHEEPFMNQGNTNCFLKPGFTFTVEPGIYVPGEFGVRLEDIFLVNEHGSLDLLTDSLATDPWA